METQRRVGLSDVHHGRAPRRFPLFAPLRYLRIRAALKARYDYFLPASGAIVLIAGYNFLRPSLEVFGSDGLLANVQSLLIMAVPFLIGALATVAMASPSDAIDRRTQGAPITLDGVILTTRQFVCYLLGYLSFIGFLLLIAIIVAKASHTSVSELLVSSAWAAFTVEQLTVSLLAIAISTFSLTTLWALYFLTDVVNRRA